MIRKYYFIDKFETINIDKQDKQNTIIYINYSSKKPEIKVNLYFLFLPALPPLLRRTSRWPPDSRNRGRRGSMHRHG